MCSEPRNKYYKAIKTIQEVEWIQIQQGLGYLACDIVKTQIPVTGQNENREEMSQQTA